MNRARSKNRGRGQGSGGRRRQGGKPKSARGPIRSTDLVPGHVGAKPSNHPAHYDAELKHKVIFFDTFSNAKSSVDKIKELCSSCDQLNVVIKAEGNMEDPEILGIHENVKLYAGEAWTLIHTRRQEEGWYPA